MKVWVVFLVLALIFGCIYYLQPQIFDMISNKVSDLIGSDSKVNIVPIENITGNPNKYEGKRVTVVGIIEMAQEPYIWDILDTNQEYRVHTNFFDYPAIEHNCSLDYTQVFKVTGIFASNQIEVSNVEFYDCIEFEWKE